MSAIAPPPPTATIPESPHSESMADFLRWAVAQLQAAGNEGARPFDGVAKSLDLDGPVLGEICEQLRAAGPAVHVRPSGQPIAVGDVAPRLFSAYRVDGGQIQLGGCQLTDVPFVRLSFAAEDSAVRHVFVSQDGKIVPAELVSQLGLLNVEPASISPPRLDGGELAQLVDGARQAAAITAESLAVAVVWTKHATGKLEFTIGESTAAVAFSDWASTLEAPPFVGEHSGQTGFRLAATDDGRIDLATAIAACEQSGRRVLNTELVTCRVTGKRVLPEFTASCPVSGRPALINEFAICTTCRERASKASLQDEVCGACRDMSRVDKDDPRLARILAEQPGLARWSRWQLAETANVYIARADGLVKRLLVVVDRESGWVRHLATGNRLSSAWHIVSSAEKQNFLA